MVRSPRLITLRPQVKILTPQPNFIIFTNSYNATKILVYRSCRNESTPSQRLTSPLKSGGSFDSANTEKLLLLHSAAI